MKTVLVILFEGFPNRSSFVGFVPSRSYCLILYGRFILNLRLRHFDIGIAVLPRNYYLDALTYALNCVDKLDSERGRRL